ncbi:hypothetical protein B0H15DRAFT_942513 [Mycena belliarum]|uniref:Uncharacterized protein n=1 Tax=Mycena belliarum TaxID=1033014 RepID=A0AAD6XV45_9AGAR|nr:hypothetical protein B0H15DRAFT_942513 [Mycena belliae]
MALHPYGGLASIVDSGLWYLVADCEVEVYDVVVGHHGYSWSMRLVMPRSTGATSLASSALSPIRPTRSKLRPRNSHQDPTELLTHLPKRTSVCTGSRRLHPPASTAHAAAFVSTDPRSLRPSQRDSTPAVATPDSSPPCRARSPARIYAARAGQLPPDPTACISYAYVPHPTSPLAPQQSRLAPPPRKSNASTLASELQQAGDIPLPSRNAASNPTPTPAFWGASSTSPLPALLVLRSARCQRSTPSAPASTSPVAVAPPAPSHPPFLPPPAGTTSQARLCAAHVPPRTHESAPPIPGSSLRRLLLPRHPPTCNLPRGTSPSSKLMRVSALVRTPRRSPPGRRCHPARINPRTPPVLASTSPRPPPRSHFRASGTHRLPRPAPLALSRAFESWARCPRPPPCVCTALVRAAAASICGHGANELRTAVLRRVRRTHRARAPPLDLPPLALALRTPRCWTSCRSRSRFQRRQVRPRAPALPPVPRPIPLLPPSPALDFLRGTSALPPSASLLDACVLRAPEQRARCRRTPGPIWAAAAGQTSATARARRCSPPARPFRAAAVFVCDSERGEKERHRAAQLAAAAACPSPRRSRSQAPSPGASPVVAALSFPLAPSPPALSRA